MHMTEDAKRIIDDSIRAVLPDAAVYRALEGRRFDRPVTVIAIGKAAWRMANAAAKALAEYERLGYGGCPVCIAKTQYSFSDNAKLLAAPEGFTVEVREARLSAGAGFVVAICGAIMTMPGLPRKPAAENIDIDADGKIKGLF